MNGTRALEGLPGGGFNIAYEAVDRHAAGAMAQQTALRWLDVGCASHDLSYAELKVQTDRFAQALVQLGIGKGDRVFTLTGRTPTLYVAALGTLKAGAVFAPLFAAFGPQPLQTRLTLGAARVLVTTPDLYRRKIAAIRNAVSSLQYVLLTDPSSTAALPAGTLRLEDLLARATLPLIPLTTQAGDVALLHFTSGTTGRPKGALHAHAAALGHLTSAQFALDLHPGDIFWCTADPGWVTGTSYGILAPLLLGATLIVDSQDFDAERWLHILDEQAVQVWYTAPTALRLLRKLEVKPRHPFAQLRFIACVGEPLDAETARWGREVFGLPIHDNWWQTETGAIMIANAPGADIRPGSMGLPLPGIEAAIVQRTGAGRVQRLAAETVGELALRAGWPSMFRGYVGDPAAYPRCFADGWYLSGDLARQDRDGYFWFVARCDDVIKSAGHLIGPFEVEGVLMEHPAVAEAAVIGKPDSVAGAIVKAFVTLKPGQEPSAALQREILIHARQRLGATLAPKELELRSQLPRTHSGKILRRQLRDEELGLTDTSDYKEDSRG
jgi:acetyl-CoA synthetase